MVGVFQSIGQQNSNLFGTFFPMADIAENILPPMATDLKSMHAISQADQPQLTYISKTLGLAAGLFGNANGSLYTIDRNVASIMSIVAKLAGVSVPSAPSGAGGNAGKPSGGGTGSGSGTVTSATMAVSINVNGANNPRDTATQIASYLRSISPVFTVGSK
jgi:hypothetical protein